MTRQMVINLGMSDIGPWSLMDPSAQQGDFLLRMMARNSMSENLLERIDENVRRISMQAYEVSKQAAVLLLHLGDGCAGPLQCVLACHPSETDQWSDCLLLQEALRHIRENREALDRIVEVLLEKETLTGDEFRELLSNYAKIPEENMAQVNAQKQKTLTAAFTDIDAEIL
jgi:cell division protease FtsH